MHGPYDDVVSLGRGCQPAHQLRRVLGIDRAHVFDWVVTTDAGLVQHIETRLQGFFFPDTLTRSAKGVIIDRRTGTSFPHETPRSGDPEEAFETHAPRLFALVDRWHRLVASDRSVLFIRQHGWNGKPRATALRLRTALRAAAPRLRFRLLYLTPPETAAELDPDQPDLLFRPLAQPDPPDWRGLDPPWDAVLAECLALPPPPDPPTLP